MTQVTATQNVIESLTADHQEMMELVGQIAGTAHGRWRQELADTLIAEVMRHAVAEEMYVYPAYEKHVPNGSEGVEHDKKEHAEIVRVMKQIEDADTTAPAFMERIGELAGMLRHHAHDEEDEQFPRLRAHVSAADLVALGEKVEAAKKLAPHSELFHKVVGLGVGLIDRLRDRLTGRHTC